MYAAASIFLNQREKGHFSIAKSHQRASTQQWWVFLSCMDFCSSPEDLSGSGASWHYHPSTRNSCWAAQGCGAPASHAGSTSCIPPKHPKLSWETEKGFEVFVHSFWHRNSVTPAGIPLTSLVLGVAQITANLRFKIKTWGAVSNKTAGEALRNN